MKIGIYILAVILLLLGTAAILEVLVHQPYLVSPSHPL